MATSSIKIALCMPKRDLFTFLQKNLNYQNTELFFTPSITELEDLVGKIRPRIIIIHVHKDEVKYRLI